MREIIIDSFGAPDVLQLRDSPEPTPRSGDVLVEVAFAGLNPIDHKMRDGSSGRAKDMVLPSGLGRELSGRVVGAAPDVDLDALGMPIGTPVFGVRPLADLRGSYAEVIAISAQDVLPVLGKDPDLSAYAGLALAGTTALTALQDDAALQPGETLLVHGGAGGVGQLLIPLAVRAGAGRVLATGRAANAPRIRDLGATPLSYDIEDWQQRVQEETAGRGVDVVIDLHYHSTFTASLDHLAPGGRIVAVPTLADLDPARRRGIPASITMMRTSRERLELLRAGFEDGTLPLEVSQVLPLEQVARGHEILEDGHSRGKIVLDVHA